MNEFFSSDMMSYEKLFERNEMVQRFEKTLLLISDNYKSKEISDLTTKIKVQLKHDFEAIELNQKDWQYLEAYKALEDIKLAEEECNRGLESVFNIFYKIMQKLKVKSQNSSPSVLSFSQVAIF